MARLDLVKVCWELVVANDFELSSHLVLVSVHLDLIVAAVYSGLHLEIVTAYLDLIAANNLELLIVMCLAVMSHLD